MNLTFLYRAPKIFLSPLDVDAKAASYGKNIRLTPEDAKAMAELTKGYSFAFQVLGYLIKAMRFSSVEKGARAQKYASSIEWLTKANTVFLTSNNLTNIIESV